MTRLTTPDTQSEPNVIPLIDVLLVLIIIFFTIVAAEKVKEAKDQKALYAQLPQNASPASGGAPASIVLEVGPDGYRVNRAPVAKGALAEHLHGIYDGRPEKVLFVKGDPAVSYQEIITAMDVARGAGVRVLGLPPGR